MFGLETNTMEAVRIRVVLENPSLLNKKQKAEGLARSWLLLKPQHKTFSDPSSYLLHIFNLHDSCPNGLLFSMDGFVLPSFELTCILKDRDTISVKRKDEAVIVHLDVDDEANCCKDEAIVGEQQLSRGVKLLANEEFDKEWEGYETESEDNVPDQPEETVEVETASAGNAGSKKRKASRKLKRPKYLFNSISKKWFSSFCLSVDTSYPREVTYRRKKNKSTSIGKSPVVLEDVENGVCKKNNARILKIDEKCNDSDDSSPIAKRCNQLQENGSQSVEVATNSTDGTRKQLHQRRSPENSPEHLQTDENSDTDDTDVVPIVIRPGHIHFEPLGKDQTIQRSLVSVETFQWNGTSSKKNGKKWGKEKMSFKRNDYKDFNQHSETFSVEEEIPPKDPMDFGKFIPLTSSPKERDTIAYRLIELSSTWTPELSTFRVGKISPYDPESNKLTLVSVPEYPIVAESKVDEDSPALQLDPDASLYREDGSLEVLRFIMNGIFFF